MVGVGFPWALGLRSVAIIPASANDHGVQELRNRGAGIGGLLERDSSVAATRNRRAPDVGIRVPSQLPAENWRNRARPYFGALRPLGECGLGALVVQGFARSSGGGESVGARRSK